MEPVQWCFGEHALTWSRDTLIVYQFFLLSMLCISVVLSPTLSSFVSFDNQISTGISFRKLHPRFYATDLWSSCGIQSSSLAVRLNPVRPVEITSQIPFDLNLQKNPFQRRKHRNMFFRTMHTQTLRIPHLIVDVYLDSHQGLVVPWTVFSVNRRHQVLYNMYRKQLLQGSFMRFWQIGQHSFLCIYAYHI